MGFYLLFFILVTFLLWLGKFKNIKGVNFYFWAYMVMFLVSALRFDVGWDYVQYYDLVQQKTQYYEEQFARFEFLNRVLIQLAQFIHFTQLYFIITSFIILFSIYKVFKRYSANFALSTLLFLALPIFFFNSLSIIRQFVAVAILFYGFAFIRERRFMKFLTLVIIATLFHKSALIGVVLYFLYGRKVHVYFFMTVFFLGFFSSGVLYWLIENMFPQYLKYLDQSIGDGGNKVLLLFQLIGFLALFFVKRLNKDLTDNTFYFLSFYIGLFIWSSLARYGHAGFRGSLYFTIYLLLLLPNIIKEIKQRRFIVELAYCFCFLFFVFTLILGKLNPKKDPNIPYRTFLINDGQFEKEKT